MAIQTPAETSTQQPPLQPKYVLRGHNAQIHSVCFVRQNTRLLTGDAEGWVVLWNVASKRPAAVWKPHQGSILSLSAWGADRIITHGRDNKLNVWQLRKSDEDDFSQVLPIDDATTTRREPWLLHTLLVNALNFCAFAQCSVPTSSHDQLLVAVPGTKEGSISIYSLPEERQVTSIAPPTDCKSGMLMALCVFYKQDTLHVIAGYEIGQTSVWRQDDQGRWQSIYAAKTHTQPILSLDIRPDMNSYFTSSADALIACHPLGETAQAKEIKTKHAGQQALTVRSDGRIFGTAGWDGRLRVYSSKTMQELAVLKWHKEGCYALAFADGDLEPAKLDQSTETSSTITRTSNTFSTRRSQKAQSTHWLAAGAKDGKVSLWEVY